MTVEAKNIVDVGRSLLKTTSMLLLLMLILPGTQVVGANKADQISNRIEGTEIIRAPSMRRLKGSPYFPGGPLTGGGTGSSPPPSPPPSPPGGNNGDLLGLIATSSTPPPPELAVVVATTQYLEADPAAPSPATNSQPAPACAAYQYSYSLPGKVVEPAAVKLCSGLPGSELYLPSQPAEGAPGQRKMLLAGAASLSWKVLQQVDDTTEDSNSLGRSLYQTKKPPPPPANGDLLLLAPTATTLLEDTAGDDGSGAPPTPPSSTLHLIIFQEGVKAEHLGDTSNAVGDVLYFASRYRASNKFASVKRQFTGASPSLGDVSLVEALVVPGSSLPRASDSGSLVEEATLQYLLQHLIKEGQLGYTSQHDLYVFVLPSNIQLRNHNNQVTCSDICTHHHAAIMHTSKADKEATGVVQYAVLANPTGCSNPSACAASELPQCFTNNLEGDSIANLLHQQIARLFATPSDSGPSSCHWDFGRGYVHEESDGRSSCYTSELLGKRYLIESVWDPRLGVCTTL